MLYRFLLLLCLLFSNGAFAFQQEDTWGHIDWANDHQGMAAVEVDLKPEWHIFWQHPGTVGVPISIVVSQDDKSEELTNFWPIPISFKVGELEAWGYEGYTTIPMAFPSWIDLQKSYNVKVKGQVCKQVCIPLEKQADIAPNTENKEIKNIENLPRFTNDKDEIEAIFERNKENNDKALLEVIVSQEDAFVSPYIFEANKINLSYKLLKKESLSANKMRFLMQVEGLSFLPNELTKGALNFLIADKKGAFYIETQAKEGFINKAEKPKISLWIIVQALFVGLIFNVMPCVLPVLGIKLSSIIGLSGKEKTEIRLRFSFTALGILLAFSLLALFLSIAKSLGAYIGWGVHFQQPLFIAFMMVIISLFAASIFGFWHLRIPSFSRKNPTKKTSLLGEVGSGVLATILATPCTAPFMAPVAAFAFAGSNFQLFLIFICIGLGMALPWLFIALFPRFISFLPKPGLWMVYVKNFLGALLILTLVWLFWVLLGQVHFYGAVAIGLACLFIFVILAIGRHATGVLASVKWIFVLGLCFMVLNMAIVVETYERSKDNKVLLAGQSGKKGILEGEAYSQQKLENLLAEGKDVLVIGTAEWCITCKVNERVTFSDKSVMQALTDKGVVILIMDMTSENKEGENWLNGLNRYGLPLTVYYKADRTVNILPTFVRKEDIFKQIKP